MKKYKILLADADGTLFDFHLSEGKALLAACASLGVCLAPEQVEAYRRINADVWRAYERGEVTQEALRTLRFERFAALLSLSLKPEAMAQAFVEALSRQADEIAGAAVFLRMASERVPVVVVTNGIAAVQRARFGRSPLAKHISGLVISGEMGFAKPDPRMVTHAAASLGFSVRDALMLGDEPRSDIAAANAAGADSCWFNPDARANDTGFRPTYEIRELAEALAWL